MLIVIRGQEIEHKIVWLHIFKSCDESDPQLISVFVCVCVCACMCVRVQQNHISQHQFASYWVNELVWI